MAVPLQKSQDKELGCLIKPVQCPLLRVAMRLNSLWKVISSTISGTERMFL